MCSSVSEEWFVVGFSEEWCAAGVEFSEEWCVQYESKNTSHKLAVQRAPVL